MVDLEKAASELAQILDPRDFQAVNAFGRESAEGFAAFSERLLSELRRSDAAETREVLEAMVDEMSRARPEPRVAGGVFARLPLIGELFQGAGRPEHGLERVHRRLERLDARLRAEEARLLSEVSRLEGLVGESRRMLRDLEALILAAEARLDWVRGQGSSRAIVAEEGDDPLAAENRLEWQRASDHLERRIQHLRMVRLAALQTEPQVRIAQDARRMLLEGIQSVLHLSLPLWQRQLLTAASGREKVRAWAQFRKLDEAARRLPSHQAQRLRLLQDQLALHRGGGSADREELGEIVRFALEVVQDGLRRVNDDRRQEADAARAIARTELALKQGGTDLAGPTRPAG